MKKPLSDISDQVALNLSGELLLWAKPRRAGEVYVETNFRCFPDDANRVRRPDVAFVSAEKLAEYVWG